MVTVTNNLLIFQVFMATLKLDKLQYPGHLGILLVFITKVTTFIETKQLL
jgi:hypothetical protein